MPSAAETSFAASMMKDGRISRNSRISNELDELQHEEDMEEVEESDEPPDTAIEQLLHNKFSQQWKTFLRKGSEKYVLQRNM